MSRVTAKICGLSTPETLDAAIAGGASHVGFVFFPKSPRNVDIERAATLAERTEGRAKVVGLFVDPDPDLIDAVRSRVRLDAIQLHGSEHPSLVGRLQQRHGIEIWKAIAVRSKTDIQSANKYVGTATRILFDAKPPAGAEVPGGTGLRFDWALLEGYRHRIPWALSGGLDARNVREAVRITGATLVDVSSGVETTPGVKDVDKIAAFLQAVAQC
jgi:phosphoribosylanthranilate isomerase